MLFTLYEALLQIDPHVVLDDGVTARTVEQLIFSVDMSSPLEYVIGVDSLGRLVLFEIDARGYPTFPAAWVEKKRSGAIDSSAGNFQSSDTSRFHPRIS